MGSADKNLDREFVKCCQGHIDGKSFLLKGVSLTTRAIYQDCD